MDEVDGRTDASVVEAPAVSRSDPPEFETRTQALWVATPLTDPDAPARDRGDGAATSLRETRVAVAPALLLLPPSHRSRPDAPADPTPLSIEPWPFDAVIDATLLRVEPAEPVVLDVDVRPDIDFEPIRRARPAARPSVGPATGVRLTIRGRRVVAAVSALALMAAVFVTVIAVRAALTRPLVPASAPAAVTVHPGDTLWSIAQRIAPQSDPRAVVAALRGSNHLPSSTVRVGQHLRVPH
jgi:LysM repeat protein